MKPTFSSEAIIFDLDGTLIDSAPSILSSFDSALKRSGLEPILPLSDSLIGPPLRQALTNLTGVTDGTVLDALVGYFKDSYDSEGYRATRVYEGVEELLANLSVGNKTLAIATNKRMVPTLRILDHLGWKSYFKRVGSLDCVTPSYTDKAAMLAALLKEMSLVASATLYVGDKREDGEAAEANGMPFIAAGWGYGNWDAAAMPPGWQFAGSADLLLSRYSFSLRVPLEK